MAQRHPFEASSLPSLFLKIKEGKYPPLPAHYGLGIRSVVDAMVSCLPAWWQSPLVILCVRVRHAQNIFVAIVECDT